MDEKLTVTQLTQVADGLAYLHNLSTPVIHCDVRSVSYSLNLRLIFHS
jgi:serine/threonine protein kinase